jgi:carbon-monoxide dehydrogenase small subunit
MKQLITLNVNGQAFDLYLPVHKTLLEVLREDLQLTGTKHGCELGECGTCTVLVDGEPVLACLALPVELQGSEILTVEGLAATWKDEPGRTRAAENEPSSIQLSDASLHPLQEAFAELGAAQCGYCTPGVLLTAKALLDRAQRPTREAIREALAGNLCRCTGYVKIYAAVELAAERMGSPVELPDSSDDDHA